MNKRNFLGLLGSTVVGALLGLHLKSLKIEDSLVPENSFRVNPEWENAEYQVFFLCDERSYEKVWFGPPPEIKVFKRSEYSA